MKNWEEPVREALTVLGSFALVAVLCAITGRIDPLLLASDEYLEFLAGG